MKTEIKEKNIQIFNLLIGFVLIVLGIFVIFFSTTAILILLFLISLGLLFAGIGRIFNAIYNKKLNNKEIILKYSIGIIATIIAIILMVLIIGDPAYSIQILINIIALAFLFIGISMILIGLIDEIYEKWYKNYLILVGFVNLLFAILILLFPIIGYIFIITIIAISLILNGLARIILAKIYLDL